MHLTDKEIEIMKIVEENARISVDDIAKMTSLTVSDVAVTLKKLEDSNIIVRYAALVDWSKVEEHEGVTAMIDVKVTPKRGVGFDETAKRIYRYEEVSSVYLMSGAYDLSVVIEGKSMNEVARFVSDKLSTLDSVISTTTHFILKKYKHDGTVFSPPEEDKRIVVSP